MVSENYSFARALKINSTYGSDDVSIEGTEVAWATFVAESTNVLNFQFAPSEAVTFTVNIYSGTTENALTLLETSTGADIALDIVDNTRYYIRFDPSGTTEIEFSWQLDAITVQPAENFTNVRIIVYEADGLTPITEIPRRVGLSCQEILNSVGVGSVQVALPDPVLAAYPTVFAWRNIVKFWLGNTCVHGFRIQNRRTSYVSTEEWAGYVKEVSGPSVQMLLDDFMVRHDADPRPDSGTTRGYGWFSLYGSWFNQSDWDNTVASASRLDPPGDQNEPAEDRAKWRQPAKWPDSTADWLYNYDFARKYYRQNFHVAENGTHVRLYATSDERLKVYLDGELVIEADNVETGYTQLNTKDVILSEGNHVVAMTFLALTTASGGDGNDSICFTLMKVNKHGKPYDVLCNSNNTWDAFFGPGVPGWHRAQVLLNTIREARLRGNNSANYITDDFDDNSDTAGRAWVDRWSDDVEVGTSGLSLQGMLSEGNGFDVYVNPATMKLQAWKKRGVDKSKSVTLEPGRNLLNWEVEEVDETRNKFLIQYEGGWTYWRSKRSINIYGEREALLTLGNSKEAADAQKMASRIAKGVAAAIKRAGAGEFRTKAESAPSGGLLAVDGARPFLDFGIGDTIKAPNENGVLVPHRVIGLSMTEDGDGTLSYDPEMEEVG